MLKLVVEVQPLVLNTSEVGTLIVSFGLWYRCVEVSRLAVFVWCWLVDGSAHTLISHVLAHFNTNLPSTPRSPKCSVPSTDFD
jgi:hypothetical protein